VTQRKRIAIIGAGIGGLSAAAILSRHAEVTVFERAGRPGGKVRQILAGGRPVDSGPTVFTMAGHLERVFELAGARLGEHVRLSPQAVLARHYWSDGTALDLHSDIDRSAAAIEDAFGAQEARAYRRFCAEARAVFETLDTPFMQAPAPGFLRLVTGCSPLSLMRTRPFSTLERYLSGVFASDKLTQLFARYSTYCGASPYAAPATLMLVAHVEQAGVWAIDGGMQALADALERVGRANGAGFVYGAHVSEIVVDGGRAKGIRVAAGAGAAADAAAARPFDLIVMNGDAAALRTGAMGQPAARALAPVASERSQSAITWSALAEPAGRPLAFHTVCFGDAYRSEFDAVFARGAVPDQPTVYICAPDRAGGAIPQGPERVFCLINAPANGDTHAYHEEEIAACRRRMLDQLARCGIRLNLVAGTETATNPQAFAEMFPETGGGLYGMASHGWQASFRRPGLRTRLPGLYLAGGSAHPGPGVPMAALSGRMAAEAIIADFGLTAPSQGVAISGGTSTPSARTAPTA